LLASTSVIAVSLVASPVAFDHGPDMPFFKQALAESGSSCFVAGTRVLMADGSTRPIERIVAGDLVMGWQGRANRVTAIERPRLGARSLYALNGGRPFVTAEHPFLTPAGWKAIDPGATRAENPALTVGTLEVGDLMAVASAGAGELSRGALALSPGPAPAIAYVPLTRIASATDDAKRMVYNLLLDGDHTYFADGFVVHNKEGGEGGEGEGGEGEGGEGEGGEGEGGEGEGGDAEGEGRRRSRGRRRGREW
jgi:hypothetical protein